MNRISIGFPGYGVMNGQSKIPNPLKMGALYLWIPQSPTLTTILTQYPATKLAKRLNFTKKEKSNQTNIYILKVNFVLSRWSWSIEKIVGI